MNTKYGTQDLLDLMKTAAVRGYYGKGDKAITIIADGVEIKITGTVIEAGWEDFCGACIVEMNGELLYEECARNVAAYRNERYTCGKYTSREETAQGLMEALKNKDCVVDTGEEKTKCVVDVKQDNKNTYKNEKRKHFSFLKRKVAYKTLHIKLRIKLWMLHAKILILLFKKQIYLKKLRIDELQNNKMR